MSSQTGSGSSENPINKTGAATRSDPNKAPAGGTENPGGRGAVPAVHGADSPVVKKSDPNCMNYPSRGR